MYIKLNNQDIGVSVMKTDDKLSLSMNGIENTMDLYAAFAPSLMPTIQLYKDGHTVEVYENHRVIGFHINPYGAVQIDLQVDPLEVSKAIELTEELETQKAAALVNETVMDEILALLAAQEARIAYLESQQPAEEITPSEEDESEPVVEEGGND